MSAEDYESAVRLMQQHRDRMNFLGPRDTQQLEAAQAGLGTTFPSSYRRFLADFGAGSFGAEEIYGITDSGSGVPDAVWFTLRERERDLPAGLVVVYAVGTGELLCLDTKSVDGEAEAPVVTHHAGAGTGQDREIVADDFGRLLLDLVQQELEEETDQYGDT